MALNDGIRVINNVLMGFYRVQRPFFHFFQIPNHGQAPPIGLNMNLALFAKTENDHNRVFHNLPLHYSSLQNVMMPIHPTICPQRVSVPIIISHLSLATSW